MKFLLIFLTITTSIFAEESYSFWVENPTMGRAYFNIFNAIVALMKSSIYGEMLQLVFLLGGFFVFIMGIFQVFKGQDGKQALVDTSKYMIAGTMLLLLVVPSNSNNQKAVLIVESGQLPSYYCGESQPADSYTGFTVSMPQTLAWGFSTLNTIGKTTTDLASTVFSNISSNIEVQNSFKQSSSNGFGSEVEQLQSLMSLKMGSFTDMNNTVVTSPTFGDIYVNSALGGYFGTFFQSCVFMINSTNSNLGTRITSAIDNTGNIQKTLEDIYVNDQISVYANVEATTPKTSVAINTTEKPKDLLISVTNEDGDEVTGSCGQFYKEIISPAISSLKNNGDILCIRELKRFTPSGLYSITGKDTASAPILESLAINAGMTSAYREYSDSSKIATDISFASGKSSAEFILNSTGTGYYMAKMLPYMQMGIRAVLYAFFPFVFLVMLLPGGFSVIKSYLQSMLWVELWSPVAAILNMFLSYFEIDRISSVYSTEGINAISSNSIVSDANMLASVGGYLYASVPALTWLVLKGSAQMLGSITGGMAAGFSKNINSESIRRDLGKATEANKVGMSISDMDMKKTLAEAERSSVQSDYTYANMDNVTAIAQAGNVNYSKLAGTGRVTDKHNLSDIGTQAEAEQKSRNLTAEQWSGMTQSERDTMSSSMSASEMSEKIGEKNTNEYIAKRIGADLNTKEGIKSVSDFRGNVKSFKSVGEAIKTKNMVKGFISAGLIQDQGDFTKNVAEAANFQARVDSNQLTLDENQKQAYQKALGMQSPAINNENSFRKETKRLGEEDIGDISNINGTYYAKGKESGKMYSAKKGQFLRVSDNKKGLSSSEFSNLSEDDKNNDVLVNYRKGMNVTSKVGEHTAVTDNVKAGMVTKFGVGKLKESFTNKSLKDISSSLASPEGVDKGLEKLYSGLSDKNSKFAKRVKSIMDIGDKNQRYVESVKLGTEIGESNSLYTSKKTDLEQNMANKNGVSLKALAEVTTADKKAAVEGFEVTREQGSKLIGDLYNSETGETTPRNNLEKNTLESFKKQAGGKLDNLNVEDMDKLYYGNDSEKSEVISKLNDAGISSDQISSTKGVAVAGELGGLKAYSSTFNTISTQAADQKTLETLGMKVVSGAKTVDSVSSITTTDISYEAANKIYSATSGGVPLDRGTYGQIAGSVTAGTNMVRTLQTFGSAMGTVSKYHGKYSTSKFNNEMKSKLKGMSKKERKVFVKSAFRNEAMRNKFMNSGYDTPKRALRALEDKPFSG